MLLIAKGVGTPPALAAEQQGVFPSQQMVLGKRMWEHELTSVCVLFNATSWMLTWIQTLSLGKTLCLTVLCFLTLLLTLWMSLLL